MKRKQLGPRYELFYIVIIGIFKISYFSKTFLGYRIDSKQVRRNKACRIV